MDAILRARTRQVHRASVAFVVPVLLATCAMSSAAQDVRVATSLDGTWRVLVDPGDQGLARDWRAELAAGRDPPEPPAATLELPVPGPLEASQRSARYDGLAWYARRFVAPLGARTDDGRPVRSVLRFGEVNAACRVWVDDVEVGSHEGWGAFEFDLGDALAEAGEHALVVRVLDAGDVETDGLTVRTMPHAKETWYHNTGGLLGSVELVQHTGPEPRLQRLIADPGSGEVRLDVTVEGPADGPRRTQARLELLALPLGEGVEAGRSVLLGEPVDVALVEGHASFTLSAFVPDPRPWLPESPVRYAARVTVGSSEIVRTFGLRPVRLDADGLSLGLTPRPLAGVLYQPWYPGLGGRTPDAAALEAEVAALKRAGFDFVRAHVRPAPPAFLEAADRLGLLVLEEPPIGWVDDDPLLLHRMVDAVDVMLERDQHHPSIVIWGMLNELSGKAYRYADELVQHAADGDASRPVLEDSGAFFGDGRYLPTGERTPQVMHDEHVYPPFPLPLDERERMRGLGRDDGPTIVSEYGYGTLLDLPTIVDDFSDVAPFDAERKLLEAFAVTAERARASGDDWSGGAGWVARAQVLQGDAAADMTDALRSNPRIDLFCYTQWQAVSHESSAGLLSPGGRERPALGALREALRPLHVALFADRASLRPGEEVEVDVVVVNVLGRAVEGLLEIEIEGGERRGPLRDAARPGLVMAGVVPVGVTRVPVRVVPSAGVTSVHVRARIVRAVASVPGEDAGVDGASRGGDEAAIVGSRPLRLPVLEAHASEDEGASLRLALLEDDAAARAFARRVGLPFVEDVRDAAFADPSTVVLVSRPDQLLASLSFGERVALWSKVRAGGTLIALVDSPRDGVSRLFGGARGIQTLDGLPMPVHLSSAAGNFMGRVFPVLEARPDDAGVRHRERWLFDAGEGPQRPRPEADPGARAPTDGFGVRLLDRFDATVAPRAMLVEPLPPGTRPAMLALGNAGDRIGVPVAAIPFGAGRLVLSGVPLLDRVLGQADARRDGVLLQLVLDGAERARSVTPADGPAPLVVPALAPLDEALLDRIVIEVSRLVDLAARESVVVGGRQESYVLPSAASAALSATHAALEAWLDGRPDDGRAVLREALATLDSGRTVGFLELDRQVQRGLQWLVRRNSRADLDLAYTVLEQWVRGLAFWSAGDLETAFDWLGRAELELRGSGRLPRDLVRSGGG